MRVRVPLVQSKPCTEYIRETDFKGCMVTHTVRYASVLEQRVHELLGMEADAY